MTTETQSDERQTQPQDDDALRQGEVRGLNKMLMLSLAGAGLVLAVVFAAYVMT